MSQPVKVENDLLVDTLRILRGIQVGAKADPTVFRLPETAEDEVGRILAKWEESLQSQLLKLHEKVSDLRDVRDRAKEPWTSSYPLFDQADHAKPGKAKDPDADTGEIAQGGPVVVRHLPDLTQGEERVALALLRDLATSAETRKAVENRWWRCVDEELWILRHPTVRTARDLVAALEQAGLVAFEAMVGEDGGTDRTVAVTEKGVALVEQVPDGPVLLPDLSAEDERWALRLLVDLAGDLGAASIAHRLEDWEPYAADLTAAGMPSKASPVEKLVAQLVADGFLIACDEPEGQTPETRSWLELSQDKGEDAVNQLRAVGHDEPLRDLLLQEQDRTLACELLVAVFDQHDPVETVGKTADVPRSLLALLLGKLVEAGFLEVAEGGAHALTESGRQVAEQLTIPF